MSSYQLTVAGAAAVVLMVALPGHAAELSAGGYHALRVDGGAVKGLGDGTYGQLGTSPAGSPATLTGLSDVTAVAAGGFSTLGLKSDGTVWFLGETTLQHTTPHGTPDPVSTPVQIAGLTGIDAIAAGHRHYLALDADSGDLFAWGHNGSGQVGNGGLLDVTTPVVVLSGVSAMAAANGFSMAVKSDGSLWAWGRNAHGQLGLGDTADRFNPTQVSGITTAVAVAAGGQHSLIRLSDDTLLATGNNDFGQLGLGNTTSVTTPTAVPGLSGVAQVSAGYFHSAALDSGDQVFVWGRNYEGQCGGGDGSPVSYPSPRLLAGLSDTPVGVECGYHFTMVLLADGTVAATGSNSDGQIDGSSVADQDDSQKVLAPQLAALSPDLTAPSPDPMRFASPPSSLGATSLTMTATTATDPSGPVVYFFNCTTPGGHDSGWQADPTYTDNGLSTGVSHTYRVKARDAVGNETGYSDPASATPEADTTPPAITSLSPANGQSDVAVDTALSIVFDEPVQKGTGNLVLKETLANDVVATIDINSVTVSGTEVAIEPPDWLDHGTPYYIEVDAGALFDFSGNAFRGIAGSKTWSFSTAVVTAVSFMNPSFEADENTSANGAFAEGSRNHFGGELTGWIHQSGSDTEVSVGWKDITASQLDPFPAVDGRESQALSLISGASVLNATGMAWSSLSTGDTLTLTISLGMRNLGILDWNENTFFGLTDGDANFGDGITQSDTVANSGLIANNPATGTQSGDGTFTDVSFNYVVQSADTTRNGNIGILIHSQGTGGSGSENQSFFDNVRLDHIGAGGAVGVTTFTAYISDPTFGLAPGEQGFAQEPDGDGLANGLEAWFGTHPGKADAGLANLSTDGAVTTFTHPSNATRPTDIAGFYQWSPNLVDWYAGDGVDGPPGGATLIFSASSNETTTTVTATSSGSPDRLFLRAGASQL